MIKDKLPGFYKKAEEHALCMVKGNLEKFEACFPHVSKNGIYQGEENVLWTSSFYPGLTWLAYELTKDKAYMRNKEAYLESFGKRLRESELDHDAGFLYTLSCVADYKVTGDERAGRLALEAAHRLLLRFREKGNYIQAWGSMDNVYPEVKIIIDTMMNLPLLYGSGIEACEKAAYAHAKTAAHYLVRPDYSSYHTYLMDPETGNGVMGKTHQGYADESTWARGQAWTVYGFALSYAYTRDQEFLTIAEKAAEVFERNLPADSVPYWDFTFHDGKPDVRDTSAGAIYCCGLMELAGYVDKDRAERYLALADRIMESLYENYRVAQPGTGTGILKEGVYHRHDGANESVIWGDYFYLEAIARRKLDWNPYWLKHSNSQ